MAENGAQSAPFIVVVNDDEATRYVTSTVLRRAGYAVEEAANGREALARAHERPDLMVLDIRLPDVNGLEVARRIKADPLTASVAILHLSASRTQTEHRVEGLESGGDAYLVQPAEPEELLATVKALLRLKRAEELARTAGRQWQATFEVLGEGVALVDGDGNVTRHNEAFARLLGVSGQLITGKSFATLLGEDAPGGPMPLDERGVRELQVRGHWLRMSTAPLDEDGRTLGAVRVLTDLTDHQRLELELRRRADALLLADQRKDEYLAMLAHELRNPLAAISTGVQLLEKREGVPRGSEGTRVTETVQRQVRHLARIVDDLLDVSRLTHGRVELRREDLDLRQLVRTAVDNRRSQLEGRGLLLTVELPRDALRVNVDPMRIEQVLGNLLDNAGKFTEPKGKVEVRLSLQGTQARIAVRDTGAGIAPELLPRIFELFSQADRSLDRARGGLGVGLTLVRQIVELHGGTVAAHSQGVGQGAELVLTLPLLAPDSASASASAAAAPSPQRAAAPDAQGLRVLLVEDNEDARDMMGELLEIWGHQVQLAADGEEGLARAASGAPQVCLLDVGLPKLDGYELARKIRELPTGPGMKLIALTGYGGAEQKALARDAGFDLHLVKPVDPEALERLLKDLKV